MWTGGKSGSEPDAVGKLLGVTDTTVNYNTTGRTNAHG